MRRVLIITLALMATGAFIGAWLGVVCLSVAAALGVGPRVGTGAIVAAGAQSGALTGMVLAPISAWSLMRRVPLWRAILEPALGTALGSIAGSVLASLAGGELAWSILGAPIGFLVAAVRLRVAFGRKAKQESVAASSEDRS